MTRQLSKTMPVNGMPARQLVRCIPARKQILLTNGTIAHVFSNLAVVIGKELLVNAHPAILAVPKVLSAPHATETAVGTMVGTFLVGHPHVTNRAVIFTKLYVTVGAKVGFGALFGEAFSADDFSNGKSIYIVMFWGAFGI